MLPVRGPVADQFTVLCHGSSREMGDPGIDPSDRIRDICTVDWNLITNEKIFRNIFINPSTELIFFFNGPPVIADFPDLIRGFIQPLAETWGRDKDNQKENKRGIGNPSVASDDIVFFHRYPKFLHNGCQRLNLWILMNKYLIFNGF